MHVHLQKAAFETDCRLASAPERSSSFSLSSLRAQMASVEEITYAVIGRLAVQSLRGKKIMVTGGPTVEFIDPVRVITNLSSGRMGLALAREAWKRGADVFYVFGGDLLPPAQIRFRRVRTTAEMRGAVMEELGKQEYDIFISAAAPSDFAPITPARRKIPTEAGGLEISLKPTPKIIEEVKKAWPRF